MNSAKTKNLKIHSNNFFCIPKTFLHANFQANWSKTEKALGFFKGRFFQNPSQNPVFLPLFHLNFSSDSHPSNVHKF